MKRSTLSAEERTCLQMWFRQAIVKLEREEITRQLLAKNGLAESGHHRRPHMRRRHLRLGGVIHAVDTKQSEKELVH